MFLDKATIDPDRPLTLHEVVCLLREHGQPRSYYTIWRWTSRGLRGVLLETEPIGGSLCTSLAALRRFFRAIAEARNERLQGNGKRRKPVKPRMDIREELRLTHGI